MYFDYLLGNIYLDVTLIDISCIVYCSLLNDLLELEWCKGLMILICSMFWFLFKLILLLTYEDSFSYYWSRVFEILGKEGALKL